MQPNDFKNPLTPFGGSSQLSPASSGSLSAYPDPDLRSPLASMYIGYEKSLYEAGFPREQIEQLLVAWREEYANGASTAEVIYSPKPPPLPPDDDFDNIPSAPSTVQSVHNNDNPDGQLWVR